MNSSAHAWFLWSLLCFIGGFIFYFPITFVFYHSFPNERNNREHNVLTLRTLGSLKG